MRRILIFLSIFFIIQNVTYAQYIGLDPNKEITQYKLKSWNIDNGMPSNTINNIIQAKNSYIWIATYSGVSRFDGINFTNFNSKNNKALLTEAVKVVCEDYEGTIWIGTQKGITLFKDNHLYRNKNLEELDSSNIECIFVDKLNHVWIGTTTNGLFKYENDSLIHYSELNKLLTGSIYSVYEDNMGNIWIGTITGEIIKYKNDTFEPFDIDNSSEGIYSFYQDNKGIIWIGTKTGVYTINNNKLQKQSDIHIRFAENIIEGTNEYLWISSSVDGVFRYNKQTHQTENLSELNGLPNNRVIKIIFDNQGNIWGGTYRNGIFQITDGKFTCYSKSEGLVSNVNTAILQYDENEFWIANEKGTIDIIRNGKVNHLKIKTPDISPQVKHLLKDSKGNVWISTYTGLLKFKNTSEKLYNMNKGFPDNYIRKTCEDSNGNIWVATNRAGIAIMKPNGNIHTINSSNGLSADYVMTIIQFKPDIMIAGTKKGIDIIKNESVIKRYTMADGLPDNMIFNIYKDKEDILWISTNSGISRFKDDTFTNYSMESGLQSNNIFDIVEDDLGYFWIPGPTGIMKILKQQLNDFADGKIQKVDYVFFDKSDGMKSSVCLGATKSIKDSKGDIWFLTTEGVAKINPKIIDTDNGLPPVYIEKVFTSDSSFNLNDPIFIHPKYNRFNIQYTAIDLIFPEKISFKYKLEPFEEEWVEANNKRAVSYTNISPGNYTFKVCSTNSHGTWNKNYVSTNINILPSWYQTLLFKIIFIIFLISTIFLWLKFRIYKINKQKDILEHQVEKRTKDLHEINTQLKEKQADLEVKQEEITSQAENLERLNIELEKHKDHLEQLVRERTEELEKAKDKAEESDRLKSAFLANMSHEIRTPMNAIVGFSNLLTEPEIDYKSKKEMVTHINNSTNSLLQLIEDIISVSKIEVSEIKVNTRKVDVHDILNNVYNELKNKLKNTTKESIEFILDNDINQNSLEIYTDASHLKKILKNLLDNAFKFTEKGQIHIGYSIFKSTNYSNIKFYVKDTGIGLSDTQKQKIFKRFSKGEDSKQKLYRGAGLGLAICKGLVEVLGGKIWVESISEKQDYNDHTGSTFLFTIPLTDTIEKGNISQKHDTTSKDWLGKTILIAEDEESNFFYFKMLLAKTKVNLIHASDGNEAVQLFRKNKVDLILMDIKMPEMDGLEATRIIKKENINIPIIAVTAFALEDDEQMSSEAGCSAYISKPIKEKELFTIINSFLPK